MQGAPECVDGGRDRPKEIDHGRADESGGGRGAVLLVIGMQNEEKIERFRYSFVEFVLFAWVSEHHAQEVSYIVQVVVRIHERLTH